MMQPSDGGGRRERLGLVSVIVECPFLSTLVGSGEARKKPSQYGRDMLSHSPLLFSLQVRLSLENNADRWACPTEIPAQVCQLQMCRQGIT